MGSINWNWFRNLLSNKFTFPNTNWLNNIINVHLSPVLLLGGLSIIMSYQMLLPRLPEEKSSPLFLFMILGITFFLLGVQTIRADGLPSYIDNLLSKIAERLNITHAQIAYIFLALTYSVIASLAAGDESMMRHLPLSIIAWIGSILLFTIGVWDIKINKNINYSQSIRWIALFFVVGFIIRGFNLNNIPQVLTGDEGNVGLSAIDFLSGRTNNIFTTGWFDFPSLYFYLESISIFIFGQTTNALRLLSALVGGLGVAAVYLLGRIFYGHLTGVLAAIFLLGYHFHIHFSRIGLNNIWDPLFFVIVIGALWYGWRNTYRNAFLVAGVGLGLSQYFYVSVRLLFGFIPIWIIIASFVNKGQLKKNIINMFVMGFATLISVLPLAWYFSLHQDKFFAPYNRVNILGDWLLRESEISGLFQWQILFELFELSMKAFTSEPIRMFYDPGVPLLRPIFAGVFLVGLLLLLFRIKESRTYIIVIWIAIFIIIGGLSTPVLAAQRYVAVAPVIALVVGFSLGEISKLLSKVWKEKKKMIQFIVVMLAAFLAVDDAQFYFIDYTQQQNFSDANTWVAQTLAEYLQDKDDSWQVAFFGSPRMGFHSIASIQYLAPHVEGFDMNQPFGSTENPQINSEKIIFVFLPDKEEDLNAVQTMYPNGQLSEEYFGNGDFLYWLYTVNLSDS